MTIPPAQNTELIPGAYKDVYNTVFSYLSPRDLSSCACVCKSLRQKVEEFNAPERLKRACKFVAEVMATPRKAYVNHFAYIYRQILRQRPLDPQEWEELRPWTTSQAAASAELSQLNLRLPSPEQLLAACEGAAAGDKKALLYDITSEFLNPETHACYRSLTTMTCELLRIMGPREHENYVAPADRLRAAVEASQDEKRCAQADIEDAVWFMISRLKGVEIAGAEESCRTLIQTMLAKDYAPEVIEKMGKTIASTLPTFKHLVEISEKYEAAQKKDVRQGNFAIIANLTDLIDNNRITARGIVRLLGMLSIGHVLLNLTFNKSLVSFTKTDWEPPISLTIGGIIALSDRFFPIRAEIRQDEQGAEVVHYTPHPLRQSATLCCDLVTAGAILYVAGQIFSYFL